jgi:hypothetical protein
MMIVYLITARFSLVPVMVRLLVGIFVATLLTTFVAAPFQYFVAPANTVPSFYLGFWRWDPGFWEIYRAYWFGVPSLTAFAAFLVSNWSFLRFSQAWRRFFLICALFAPFWLLVPYTWAVFPNIDYAVGGAQPRVVTLRKKADAPGDVSRQFLWHSDASFVFVSPIKRENPFLVQGIAVSEISTIEFHQVITLFDLTLRLNRFPLLDKVLEWGDSSVLKHRDGSRP